VTKDRGYLNRGEEDLPETVAALFRSRLEAEWGLRKLKEAGFMDDQMSIVTPRVGRKNQVGH
jgi:hypothetical protein